MAPAAADVKYPLMARLRSASREALKSVTDRFDTIAKDLDNLGLEKLAGELVSVAKMLDGELVVTRYLTLPSEDAAPRVRLLERLLSGKVGDPTLEAAKGSRLGAMVCQLRSRRRRRTRGAASVVGSRRHARIGSTRSKTSCSGLPGSLRHSRVLPSSWRVRGSGGRPSRVAAQCAPKRDRQEQQNYELIAGADYRAIERSVGRRRGDVLGGGGGGHGATKSSRR